MTPLISVVLGTYERLPFLKLTIESLRAELLEIAHEIIVVDGGSTDGTIEWLVTQKDVLTIVQHNRGEWNGRAMERRSWGYFMNLGFRSAAGTYVCMISDDCLIIPGSIQAGVRLFEEQRRAGKNTGAVAFYWRNWPEASRYWVGRTLGGKLFVNHGLFLREAINLVGLADEDKYFFYHADGDLCLKLWHAGYECIDSPESFVEHFSHANAVVRASNQEKQREDWATYLKTWAGIFFDPSSGFTGDWIEREYLDSARTAEKFRPLMGISLAANDRFVRRGLKPALAGLGLLSALRVVRQALRRRPN